jgi:hypothetical protein
MLNEKDLINLDNLIRDAVRVRGFFCAVGTPEIFPDAIKELQKRFEIEKGISGGRIIDMKAIDSREVKKLIEAPPPVVYFTGFAETPTWENILINRNEFIARKVIVIFFFNPSQNRRLSNEYPSIASLITATLYPLGGQHTLDDMGKEFENKLLEVLDRIDKYENKLKELIQKIPPDFPSDFLLVLRRWNSFSPILGNRPFLSAQEAEESVWRQIRREVRGGGYFLRWKNFGIAIDPGHNFIENLYQTKHFFSEIDAIVITHDHLDHTSDFEAILDLLYQYNKLGNNKKVSLYLNPTTYQKYKRNLTSDNSIDRIKRLELDPQKSIIISKDKGIRLSSILSRHIELGGEEKAVSLRFQLSTGRKGEKNVSVGFTSDTGWHEKLKDFLNDVDVLVPHVGSIKRYELDEARFYPTHLGILGLFKTLQEISEAGGTPTVVISEFGEELWGLRDIFGKELGQKFPRMKIFPSDIGHFIELNPGNIRVLCGKNCKEIAVSFFEHDGEIQLRCEAHKPTLGSIG